MGDDVPLSAKFPCCCQRCEHAYERVKHERAWRDEERGRLYELQYHLQRISYYARDDMASGSPTVTLPRHVIEPLKDCIGIHEPQGSVWCMWLSLHGIMLAAKRIFDSHRYGYSMRESLGQLRERLESFLAHEYPDSALKLSVDESMSAIASETPCHSATCVP